MAQVWPRLGAFHHFVGDLSVHALAVIRHFGSPVESIRSEDCVEDFGQRCVDTKVRDARICPHIRHIDIYVDCHINVSVAHVSVPTALAA